MVTNSLVDRKCEGRLIMIRIGGLKLVFFWLCRTDSQVKIMHFS